MKRRIILLVLVLSGMFFLPAQAQQDAMVTGSAIKFSADDRVLVIAPHPDDEAIGTGGVLQQAVKAGAKARICLVTNGENNEFAFIVYERRIVLKPKEFLRLGEVRRQESVDAMHILGLPSDAVISLGYPDFGTMEIFLKYWGTAKPFRSMLSRTRKVPYQNSLSPGFSYVGENLLRDLKQVIADFRPTKIFVSHPGDVNRDHRAVYLFTRIALWDLAIDIGMPSPKLYPYIVHVPGWPVPRGYHPELTHIIPAIADKGSIYWAEQLLDLAEVSKKYDAILEYPSQIKYAPRYLVTFARRTELFGDFPSIGLLKQMVSDQEIVWSTIGLRDPLKSRLKSDADQYFEKLEYARQGNYLVVRIILKRLLDREFGLSVFLMGYADGVPFSEMPKISLLVGLNGFYIKDKKSTVHSKEVLFLDKGKELIFKVPLTLLGEPDRILTSTRTAVYDLPLDESPWRVLEMR
jgi:LmbE family N-acetylglucosaminyl deacetylase